MKNGERERKNAMQYNKTRDFNIFVFVGSEKREKKIEMKSNIFV